jgi:hypothetical protein
VFIDCTLLSGKQRLQKWLRGHCASVNSAGFIRYWAPMFKSEGPAQIALIVKIKAKCKQRIDNHNCQAQGGKND